MLCAMRTAPLILSLAFLIVACAPEPQHSRTIVRTSAASDVKVTPTPAKGPTQDQGAAATAWRPRPPSVIKKGGNHLKSSGSLYLRQHAFNPLEWYPWGPEALARAKRENKVIFLSIGYSSCHWCHVMEHKVFEHEDVAAFMNAHFVSIKVDREERPDLDEVYMNAVQAMTGRGGWPMTVFLTPDLKPFMGGTYFPKRRFMALAREVLKMWREDRKEVEAKGQRLYRRISRKLPTYERSPITAHMLRGTARNTADRIDPVWGGFKGQRIKFPVPLRWHYLLHAYRKWAEPKTAAAVRVTLDMMASGGMYDHVGGGFCRYSTDPRWIVPHFEKMLYDNTQLASLYMEAGAALGDANYDAIAKDILEFMLREWHPPKGAFYASYDADSGGHEGSFYVWTPSEILAIAGPKDGPPLAMLLGVTRTGNFEGKSIPTRRTTPDAVGRRFKMAPNAVSALWLKYRPKLLQVRAKRVAPGLDKKIVTAWNGLAIAAFAEAYGNYGDPRYRRAAEEAADYLWRVHRRPTWGFYRASNAGKPIHAGVLDDYAFVADGLVSLFMVTGELKHLDRAQILLKEVQTHFVNPAGGWFFTEKGLATPLGRQTEPWDSVRPSGISRLMRVTLRLAALLGAPTLYDRVSSTLGRFATLMRRARLGMAGWFSVALYNLGPFYEVIVAGDKRDPVTQKLANVYRALRPSWSVKITVPAKGGSAALKRRVPPTTGKVARKGVAHAYVCIKGTCNHPTSDPKALRGQVLAGWKK